MSPSSESKRSMDIDVTQSGGVTVVVPRGDLDMATVDEVRRALTGLIDRGQSRLLMDLSGVGYIDSSGMGALVAAMKQARAAGGDVRLCALQEDVRGIFELTRLARAMSIHPTRREALASWR
jgi:anti-sigma B factor antagonist